MAMNTEEKEKRRGEILAAARDVFLEKGFAGASLMEIATRAHASKETLYAWFGNKTQLLAVLLDEGMKELGARVFSSATDGSPESVLYVIAVEVLRMINRSPLVRLFNVAGAGAGSSPELLEVLKRRALDHSGIASFLAASRERGLMKFDDPVQMASIFVSMVQAEYPNKLALGAISELSDAEIEAHARLVTQMFLKAVAP